MKFARTLGALAVATALSTGAYAADMPDAAIQYASPAFNWDGFYAGVGITGGAFMVGPVPSNHIAVDGIVGVNMTSGDFLFGAEGQLSWANDFTFGGTWNAKGEIRAGYLVAPEALIYVALAGKHWGGGANYAGIGAGVEFAVTDDITLDFEGVYYPWSNTAYTEADVSASLLWHF